MGGSSSSAPPPPPPPPPAPAPVPVVDPQIAANEAERKARLDEIARRRRSRAGLIATSERGVLAPLDGVIRKTLLGE